MKPFFSSAILGALACMPLSSCEDIRLTESMLQVDTFQQSPMPSVDILWVVDNSQSMESKQKKLGAKISQFMSRLSASGVDYHIGIISTDTEDSNHSGRLQGEITKVITPATNNPEAVFSETILLPITSNLIERGLDALRLALSDSLLSGPNQEFLRSEAALFVIVVSDADDRSFATSRYYSRWLEQYKGQGNDNLVSFSAIVGPLNGGCKDVIEPGERYLEVQQMTGGLFYNICEEDYGPVVAELGITAAGLRRKYYLSEIPMVNSIEVLVYSSNDPECTQLDSCQPDRICAAGHRCAHKLSREESWVYQQQDNSILFSGDYLPQAGVTIEVAYYRGGA